MSDRVPKGIFNVNWKRVGPWILSYLSMDKRPKSMPKEMRRYGIENFEERDGHLYVYGRRVVVKPKEIQKVLAELEEGVGGYQAAYSRIKRTHIGVTLRAIQKYFNESERRQLKRPKGSVNRQKTFITTSSAGSIEADCLFFRGSGNKLITVFGFVDEFSRWIFYKTIPNKTPWSTGAALKEGIEEFEKLIKPGRVYKCRVDGGTEFFTDPRNNQLPKKDQKIDFKGYCKQRKIHLVAKKQPARMIESTNLRLRRYIERVQYGTRRELTLLVRRFCEEKNTTKHTVTQMAPIDALALDVENTKKLAKAQLKRGQKRVAGKEKKKMPKHVFVVGDLARLQLRSEKTSIGHAGPKPTWSKTIYRIKKIVGSTRGAKRYQIEVVPSGKKVPGLFFGWRLQHIVKPTHNIDTPLKYDPGREEEGDREREEEARRPDLIKEPSWVKPNYKDAQDKMESDGEEWVPEEKQSEPPKKKKKKVEKKVEKKEKKEKKKEKNEKKVEKKEPKEEKPKLRRSKRKPKKKKEYKILGRKIYVWLYDEGKDLWYESSSPPVVIDVYRDFYIVRWRDGSLLGVNAQPGKDSGVKRMTDDLVTPKTLQKYIAMNTAQIKKIREEIDVMLEDEE